MPIPTKTLQFEDQVVGTSVAVAKPMDSLVHVEPVSMFERLARDPSVLAINRIVDYQLALTETVPYIGATAVQKAGFKGGSVAEELV